MHHRAHLRARDRLLKGLGLAAVSLALALGSGAVARAQAPAQQGLGAPGTGQALPTLSITRLDCGTGDVPTEFFSDTLVYEGRPPFAGVVSCYLVRHGDKYLLWDAGLARSFSTSGANPAKAAAPFRLQKTIVDQLAQLGIAPRQIDYVAVSHAHFDHVGQAADFPSARLLIGGEDLKAARAKQTEGPADWKSLTPWLSQGANAEGLVGDKDVFGDGTVIILATPGHTHGHHSLLVRLRKGAPVILTGDLWHAVMQIQDGTVSARTESRADALASSARIKDLAARVGATIIVSHDPQDVSKLPAFPSSAQ